MSICSFDNLSNYVSILMGRWADNAKIIVVSNSIYCQNVGKTIENLIKLQIVLSHHVE
jgi:hypothetical protein